MCRSHFEVGILLFRLQYYLLDTWWRALDLTALGGYLRVTGEVIRSDSVRFTGHR